MRTELPYPGLLGLLLGARFTTTTGSVSSGLNSLFLSQPDRTWREPAALRAAFDRKPPPGDPAATIDYTA